MCKESRWSRTGKRERVIKRGREIEREGGRERDVERDSWESKINTHRGEI